MYIPYYNYKIVETSHYKEFYTCFLVMLYPQAFPVYLKIQNYRFLHPYNMNGYPGIVNCKYQGSVTEYSRASFNL